MLVRVCNATRRGGRANLLMTLEQMAATRRSDAGAALRVLVDPGGYHCRSSGDSALLQGALHRLRNYWPRADVRILTVDREPDACNSARVDEYLVHMRRAHLVLMSGSSSLNDGFTRHALLRLEALRLAMDCGAAVALVGQSVGPMSGRVLRAEAAGVLPRCELICVRDAMESVALLQEIGVPSSRLQVMNEDAVELAYQARSEHSGTAIGIDIGLATHSGLGSSVVNEALHATACAVESVGTSVRSLSPQGDAGCRAGPLTLLPGCRVVVSTRCDMALCALSMGVAVVGIAGCDYYVQQFRSLADRFGPACQFVKSTHPGFGGHLQAAIESSWQSAPALRRSLLRATLCHVSQTQAAWRRLFAQVEKRSGGLMHPLRSRDWWPAYR